MCAFMSGMLGQTATATILRGLVNQVTGADIADIAGRVGLSDLWFRDAARELEGRGAYYNLLEQAAGSMGAS